MLEKKYETYTYSELVQEYRTVVEKTEVLKRELIVEMAKRKEIEGIEKKKIAVTIHEDLKDLISSSYIRNILSNSGFTDIAKTPGKMKKEIEELQPILVGADGNSLEEPEKQVLPEPKKGEVITNDVENLLENAQETEIIDQRPQEERIEEETNDLDKIELLRNLKIENNNLKQELGQVDQLLKENQELRQTISELEKENNKLFNKNKELEDENNKLKQENRALRNPPKVEPTITDRFSKTSHADYNKQKYYKVKQK